MNEIILQVSEESEGERLDRYIADEIPEISRTHVQKLIDEGDVTTGGRKIKASDKAVPGEEVIVRIPDPVDTEILPEDIPLDILYEDSDVMIVNKPKGMIVHPAPGHVTGTLVNAVLYHSKGELSGINGVLRPGIVHRIDKDTTGALIVCKNDSAHRKIAEQLKVHSIRRVYRGIVCGCIKEDEGTISGNIGRDPRNRKKMAVLAEGGKRAVTHYKVLERFPACTYCEFTLETGRTHQIRVHMAKKSHPLLGDTVYGPEKCEFNLTGQTLHAMIIGFIHPTTGRYVEFTAPLPEYFEKLLMTLRQRT